MAIQAEISIKGLPELQKKLDAAFLVHPAVDEAVQKIMDRPFRPYGGLKTNLKTGSTTRRGKGGQSGIANNALTATRRDLSAVIESTLHHPRRTGSAWTRYNIAAMRSMAPNVMRAAARRVEASFAS